jgi:hypothetical protein
MPTMIRVPGKPQKIAYKILGVPTNIAYRRDAIDKKINRRLVFEESIRVR